jgi:hypothetical protein
MAEKNYDSTCWYNRFHGDPCPNQARWMGPQNNEHALTRNWRACDRHKLLSDVPIMAEVQRSASETKEPQ